MTYYCSTSRCRHQWRNTPYKTCRSCRQRTTALKPVPRGTKVYVTPDVPEHFNISLNTVVKNGKHLKELQRKHNCQDWQPVNNSPGSQLTKERLRSDRQRIFPA